LIRGRHHLKVESGHGERREIGRLAKVGFQRAEPAERYDPEGCRNPEGEWKQVGHSGASDRSGFGEGSMRCRRGRPGTLTS